MSRDNRIEHINSIPLCVDLDGTLVKTDIFIESILLLIRTSPLYLLAIPIWFLRGRAALKNQIAKRVDLNASGLPYRLPLLEYLTNQRTLGRTLVLATATNEKYATQIADHLAIFDQVLASDSNTNLKSKIKSRTLVKHFGDKGFDYAGDSTSDIEVWKHAQNIIVVGALKRTIKQVGRIGPVSKIIDCYNIGPRTYLKAIRAYQWLKNILIFAPIIASHQFTNIELLHKSSLGFLSFCFCASSVYLINDLFDLQFDRKHAKKCNRPLASGLLRLSTGITLALVLLTTSLIIAWYLPYQFTVILTSYFLISLIYSLYLKSYLIVDVITLASLYTTRIIAGSAATFIMPSFWMLAFSMFLFLSLALVKRYAELYRLSVSGASKARGRGYETVDLESLTSLGTASGYLAVLVLALYINSEEVQIRYNHPEGIWLLCPLLLYWTSRLWVKARRGLVNDDPVLYAVKDRASKWILAASLVILYLSS